MPSCSGVLVKRPSSSGTSIFGSVSIPASSIPNISSLSMSSKRTKQSTMRSPGIKRVAYASWPPSSNGMGTSPRFSTVCDLTIEEPSSEKSTVNRKSKG